MNAVPVIALDHPVACDAARVGDDAAALATARVAGLPVGPGVVLTPQWSVSDSATTDMLWRIVSHDGAMSLAVRPSLVGSSSLEPARVVHSATALLAAAHDLRRMSGPVAVLVQPQLPVEWRGVLIADDGGTAGMRRRHLVHAATSGGDWIAEVDRAGRVRRVLAGQQLDPPRSKCWPGWAASPTVSRPCSVRRTTSSSPCTQVTCGRCTCGPACRRISPSTSSRPPPERGQRQRDRAGEAEAGRHRRPRRGVVEGSRGEVVGHATKRARLPCPGTSAG